MGGVKFQIHSLIKISILNVERWELNLQAQPAHLGTDCLHWLQDLPCLKILQQREKVFWLPVFFMSVHNLVKRVHNILVLI